ncbi:hypothetical protein cyc_03231 [Cyclospora cayetanensis]|uniref:Transmembrane protein n=1 Tax=Cyclospora cayetanensis TaxID=88456 RepID=A0A1D3CV78_9EIME|nr:hypothetical protein cyc_03231 [Cyclospora cayetanensis]
MPSYQSLLVPCVVASLLQSQAVLADSPLQVLSNAFSEITRVVSIPFNAVREWAAGDPEEESAVSHSSAVDGERKSAEEAGTTIDAAISGAAEGGMHHAGELSEQVEEAAPFESASVSASEQVEDATKDVAHHTSELSAQAAKANESGEAGEDERFPGQQHADGEAGGQQALGEDDLAKHNSAIKEIQGAMKEHSQREADRHKGHEQGGDEENEIADIQEETRDAVESFLGRTSEAKDSLLEAAEDIGEDLKEMIHDAASSVEEQTEEK